MGKQINSVFAVVYTVKKDLHSFRKGNVQVFVVLNGSE